MATRDPLLEELPSSSIAPSRRHNFTFLTAGWGTGQILRCTKDPSVVGGKSGGSPAVMPHPSGVQSISAEAVENAELPWNLRRRRTLYKGDSSKSVIDASGKAKIKLSVSLSSKEIEADFLLMTGKKPHKRPKKRPRHVRKQLEPVFPGMWLSDVNPDLYKCEERLIN